MRPGSRRPRPWWRRWLAAVWREARRTGPPPGAALLVLALCGAIAVVCVALYLLAP